MPSQRVVSSVADRLVAAGQPVSLRSVIPLLRLGGSHRDVGPLLSAWKLERGYKRRLVAGDLPEALQGQLVGFVRSVWGAAQADASGRLAEERERIEAERGANEELRNEALGMVDGLAAQNAALRANAMALEGQVAELEERIRKLNVSEFWDRVIREIADRLPLDGGRTAAQVLRDLPLSLVREAERYREPLTPGEINKKMTVRAEHGRYFLRHGDGSFTRKPPWAAAGQDVTGGSARGPARADDPSEGAPGLAS